MPNAKIAYYDATIRPGGRASDSRWYCYIPCSATFVHLFDHHCGYVKLPTKLASLVSGQVIFSYFIVITLIRLEISSLADILLHHYEGECWKVDLDRLFKDDKDDFVMGTLPVLFSNRLIRTIADGHKVQNVLVLRNSNDQVIKLLL